MRSQSLYRLAATAMILSAASTVPGFLTHPAVEPAGMTSAAWQVSHLLLWVGAMTGVIGLSGLYLRQKTEFGRLGLGGAALAIVGLVALSGAYYYEAVIVPILAVETPALMGTFPAAGSWAPYRVAVVVSGVSVGLGFVLFGIAMARTRLLPRWAIVAASVGALGAGVQFALPGSISRVAILVLGLGLAGLGYGLWASASTLDPAQT